jgi:hypothetical protein
MLKGPLEQVRRRVVETVKEALDTSRALVVDRQGPSPVTYEEPPVVARLMVEIRSDGSRTIARGALEDIASGERVAVQAEGTTPAQLAGSLAKSLLTLPLLASRAMRSIRTAHQLRPEDSDDDGNRRD